ncbi:MAG: sensor histidine kinase [Myxococcota bacterium]
MTTVAQRGHGPLIAAMVLSTGLVAAWIVWDTEQQSQHAVDRLALAQGTLAHALAMDLESRLQAEESAGHDPSEALRRAREALLRDAARLSAARETLVFVGGPRGLVGASVELPASLSSLVHGDEGGLVISRDDARQLGLPEWRAVATWRTTSRPGLGVLLVASASVERRHARREEWISVLGILGVGAIVLGFGLTVMRRDAEHVRLEHVLERQRLERERDEQLARAERIAVASALSLGIAHELATPLGVIATRLESLRRSATDERSAAALTVIGEQITVMRQVMQGFLSLVRGDAPETVQLAPEELARAAARAVLHRFTAAGVHLDLEISSGPLPQVSADETLVRQALANVLINAAQASAPGSRVTLRLAREEGFLAFHVVDHGHGIPPEIVDQVTQPLVTTRAHTGGTGLGLAITQELARHHGGTFTIAPGPGGVGTEAVLRLPLSSGSPA